MMKVLVTGFEPFGGEQRNPSAEIVESLPDRLGEAEIIKLILPVVKGKASTAIQKAVESYRISTEQKTYLKSLRRK